MQDALQTQKKALTTEGRLKISKKIMRLCTLAETHDGYVGDMEKWAITRVVLLDWLRGSIKEIEDHIIENYDESQLHIEENYKLCRIIYGNPPTWGMVFATDDDLFKRVFAKCGGHKLSAFRKYACAHALVRFCIEQLHEQGAAGLFVDSGSLSDKEVAREVHDMMSVIMADGVANDLERESFLIVCKIFQIKEAVKIWNRLVVQSMESIENSNVLFRRKERIDLEDIKSIHISMRTYNIGGNLGIAILSALATAKNNLAYHRTRTNNIWTRHATIAFFLSAIWIYICATCLITERKSLLEYLLVDPDIGEHIGGDSLVYLIIAITALVLLCRTIFSYIYRHRWPSQKELYKEILPTAGKLLLAVGVWSIIDQNLLNFSLNSIVLCIMMISIEWMVFMRTRISEKQDKDDKKERNNTTMLIVFVVAAIVIDICFGIIEIPHEVGTTADNLYTIKTILPKICSALLLGMLCFFSGKFFELKAQQGDSEDKEASKEINAIRNHLKYNMPEYSNKRQQENYSIENITCHSPIDKPTEILDNTTL